MATLVTRQDPGEAGDAGATGVGGGSATWWSQAGQTLWGFLCFLKTAKRLPQAGAGFALPAFLEEPG